MLASKTDQIKSSQKAANYTIQTQCFPGSKYSLIRHRFYVSDTSIAGEKSSVHKKASAEFRP